MFILLKLWGIAMVGAGGYFGYTLVDLLFFQGKITTFPTFLNIFSLLGILVCITLVWGGFKLLSLKRNNGGNEQ